MCLCGGLHSNEMCHTKNSCSILPFYVHVHGEPFFSDENYKYHSWFISQRIWRTGKKRNNSQAQRETCFHLPLKCFGQHTNSTPENSEMPHGSSMAKLRICMPRSWQAAAPVWFHLTNGQHRDALWMWSKRHPSGTSNASDWNGPSAKNENERKMVNFFNWICIVRCSCFYQQQNELFSFTLNWIFSKLKIDFCHSSAVARF